MSFTPTNFQDLPSTATPIDAAEMNKLGTQHAAAVADSAAQVPGLVDNALSTDAVIRAAADTAVSDAITAEGGVTDPTIAAALSDTASDSRGVLDATIAAGQDLIFAGQIALSEIAPTRIPRGSNAQAQLTPDGRTKVSLVTGQAGQSYILSNCTQAADTTRFKAGTQSIKVTPTDTGMSRIIIDPVFPDPAPDPHPFGAASLVRAWLYLTDASKISAVSIGIAVDATFTNTWNRAQSSGFVDGWNLISHQASYGDVTQWGQAYRMTLSVTSSGVGTYNWGEVWTETTIKAQILFIEDRGYKTFVDKGLPDLRSLGVPVTWALDPLTHGANVGTLAEVITDDQVATFAAAGDDISIHAYDGAVTSTMTPEQIRTDALSALKWLQDRGYENGRQWRAAWTQNSAPNAAAAKPYFAAYATARSSASMEAWPMLDPYNVSRYMLHGRSESEIDGMFATLQKTNSLWVVYTHGVSDLAGAISQTDWDYFISKLTTAINAGWLEGVTFSQLLSRSGGVVR